MNFSQLVLKQGGKIAPLLLSAEKIIGPSLTNPSVLNLNGKLLVNLRNINYVLYHSELGQNEHFWGPLCYIHPEQNCVLATHNILCEVDSDYNIIKSNTIDTSLLDSNPLWEFIGLEDGRLAYWENKIFLSGVRRDTTTNGQGRMELSEICYEDLTKEVSRKRMPAPPPDNSYCEKNWMPILDLPYHYIKWSNPTEVVKYDPNNNTTETVILTQYQNLNTKDLRGGSQVISYKDNYLALLHEVDLFNSETGKKNATYKHRFGLWDKNFNLIKISPLFDFMDGKIEFACGMCEYNEKIIITFGFQDNAAYLLEVNKKTIDDILKI